MIPRVHIPDRRSNDVITIGIVGAGISGLYAALMLDYLKDSGFTYEILEANPDDTRVGGRLYTHRFKDGNDVGAMRFPALPWMTPTFDLLTYLKITETTVSPPPLGSLIKYVMSTSNNVSFFNNIIVSNASPGTIYPNANPNDPFNTGVQGLTGTPDAMAGKMFKPFISELETDWETGWQNLMKYDLWSTRDYMARGAGTESYSPDVRLCYSCSLILGLYDCALSESILDYMDFDGENTAWSCIEGGTDIMASRAIDMLSQKVQRGQRVTAIVPVGPAGKAPTSINLTINGTETKSYPHVITTMPLGCLNAVDTSQCNFPWELKTAIRALHYDDSVKVGIRFKERWWEGPRVSAPQIGGVSSTDRPTRTVVYPSYGIGGDSATIIVSYTWAQDALRFGSYIRGEDGPAEQALLAIIFKDLTDMHGIKDAQGNPDYTYLPSIKVEHHAWSWYGSEFSVGAFALFGPSQFKQLYPFVTKPAFGLLHFAGEATSSHHAWIVGALNSAYRSLVEIFTAEGRPELIKKLKASDSPFKNAGTYEVNTDLVTKQVALGQHRI
ncbi:hypothetical protein BDV93DRAFT_582235 [Ceratobasidium sp. AG-I]|nr:hypothetical protein BDV93DRAFT_582235 [Ceratobasidium sp. AG-I]